MKDKYNIWGVFQNLHTGKKFESGEVTFYNNGEFFQVLNANGEVYLNIPLDWEFVERVETVNFKKAVSCLRNGQKIISEVSGQIFSGSEEGVGDILFTLDEMEGEWRVIEL